MADIEMNPSQKRQNELNPNIPPEFVTLKEQDIKFATEVYINERDPKEVYIEMGLDKYSSDFNTMGKYKKKKGEKKNEQQIQLGITRMLARVKEYGEYIKKQKEEEYQQSEAYSKTIAIQTCLTNIQIAREAVERNNKILNELDTGRPDYVRLAAKFSNMIAQGQKTILDYLKELNRLQSLYTKEGGPEDKVTLVFNDNAER